jgi:hypothetical protein
MMWACRECGTNISAEAEVCPRCGLRLKPPVSVANGPGVGTIAGGVFVGLLLWSIFTFVVVVLLSSTIAAVLAAAMQHATQP